MLADLAVGAPLSGHAVVILTRPAARLAPRITASTTELSFSATSFLLTACLQYSGYRAEPLAGECKTLCYTPHLTNTSTVSSCSTSWSH